MTPDDRTDKDTRGPGKKTRSTSAQTRSARSSRKGLYMFPEGIPKGMVPVSASLAAMLREADLTSEGMRLLLLLMITEQVECVRRKPMAYYAWELRITEKKVLAALTDLERAGFVRRIDGESWEAPSALIMAPGLFPCRMVDEQERAVKRWLKLEPPDEQTRERERA